MSRELADHLKYYAEIGVDGVSRDAKWRQRAATEPFDSVDAAPGDVNLAQGTIDNDDTLTSSKPTSGQIVVVVNCARSAARRSSLASAIRKRD